MKKLVILLPLVLLSLAACKVRSTGDIYDINKYDTHIYCNYRDNKYPEQICKHCEPWNSISDEKLRTAQSITCTYLDYTDGFHCHYVVTWVN